jgi:uncharacterized membrane protein YgcG
MADTASLPVLLLSSLAKRGIWVLRGAGRNRDSSSLARLGMTKGGLVGGLGRSELRLYRTVASCFLLVIFATPLFARSWRVADFSDTITVHEDGSAAVHERITLAFDGEWHGIHRFIPIEYPGARGTNYTLFLRVTGMTDGGGSKLKYESSTANGFRDLKIFIPDAVDAIRTVEIDYTVRNGTRFFEDHDEFYWNVTGNDWPVPIDHASALVSFPSAAAGSLRAQAFTGAYGSAEHDATAEVRGAEASFETNNPLPMRGGMTIDIFIPKGILKEAGAFTRFKWFVGSNPIVFLPFWTFAVMFTLWWYKGRDPDPGLSVAPMYEPPAGMTPAEAGTLLEDKVHPRDITCTLVDLAVRGFVKIEEVDDKGLVFHHKDYLFHRLKPMAQWGDLAPFESVMLTNVFLGGEITRLSSLKNRFYTAIPAIRQDIMSRLRKKGMYLLDPDSANAYSVFGIVLIVAPFLMLQFLWNKDIFTSVVLVIGCGFVSAILWWLFASEMTAKTVQGGRTRVAVLGFQEFMNRVDADRLKRMPPDTFEKYLPYAMALGVEHHWAQAFAGIVQNPPNWYVSPNGGVGGFNPIFFSNSMHSMATDMHQVFASAPRASSTGSGWSGGGGGGGFSGGGFGGGGGSAF